MVDFNSVQSLLLVWKPCVPSNHRSRPTETRSWRTLASIWPVIVDRNPVSNDQRGHPPSSGWRRPEHRQFWTLLAVETSTLENALHAAGSTTRAKSPHRGQRRGRRPRRPPRGRTGQRCCACAAQRTAPALGAPHPANRRASAACRSMRHASGSASQEVAQLCCPSGTYSHLRWRDQAEQRYSAEKGSIIMSDKGNELDMLTAQQVHDLTGVPISTLHDWASKRERGIEAPGPHHLRLSDRHRRWARRDVVAWLNAARI